MLVPFKSAYLDYARHVICGRQLPGGDRVFKSTHTQAKPTNQERDSACTEQGQANQVVDVVADDDDGDGDGDPDSDRHSQHPLHTHVAPSPQHPSVTTRQRTKNSTSPGLKVSTDCRRKEVLHRPRSTPVSSSDIEILTLKIKARERARKDWMAFFVAILLGLLAIAFALLDHIHITKLVLLGILVPLLSAFMSE